MVLGVGIGTEVTDPNSCDSGYTRFVPYVNGSGGSLYCIEASSVGQWAYPLSYMQNASYVTFANPISSEALEVQMDLAESATIWTTADDIYWDYKFNGMSDKDLYGIKEYTGFVWIYIWALFVLILEVVKLVFYIVETLLVIYILFTLIPETFFKLRDALVKSYIRRYAT